MSKMPLLRYCQACEDGLWHLSTWDKADPAGTTRRFPYKCGSWRHEGTCRHWKGAQDWVRVREALSSRPDWSYLVLTFPQRDWPDKTALYRFGVIAWSRLRKRLTRRFGMIQYVQTWERHLRGGAHVNIVLANEGINHEVLADPSLFCREYLAPNASACGFGHKDYCEPMRGGTGAMSGYLVKLASELVGAAGKNQIPEDAPSHFRRIRASAKTLPPINRSGLTGRLVQCPVEAWEKLSAPPNHAPTPLAEVSHDCGLRNDHESLNSSLRGLSPITKPL